MFMHLDCQTFPLEVSGWALPALTLSEGLVNFGRLSRTRNG